MKFFIPLFATFAAMASAQAPSASNNNWLGSTPSERHVVNETQIMAVLQACAQEATKIGSPSCISVVNPYSQLVGFLMTDNSVTVSIDVSMKKAKTVALFNGQFTSAQLYNLVQPGGTLFGIELTSGGLVVFGGGVPLAVDGYFIGALGVSGGTIAQDEQVAAAGVNAIGGYLAPGATNSTSK